MGAPQAPVVQQMAVPSADEKAAKAAADQQKRAALLKINQDVFARSQGLRGAASMYDWAGPTPFLAGAHVPGQPVKPKDDGDIDRPAGGPQGFGTLPWGTGVPEPPRLPGTSQGAPRNTGAVPGIYSPLAGTSQGAPVNTGWVPVTGGRLPGTSQGAPRNTGAPPLGGPPTAQSIFQQQASARLGITPRAPAPTPASTTAPTPVQQQARATLGITPKPPAPTPMPSAGAPTASGGQSALQAAASKALGVTAKPATAPAPAPKAPAATAAAPPQPLAQPAPTVTTRPTTAPAPTPTLGGVAKPVVYANPNLKTIAPMPKASLISTGAPAGGGRR